MGTLSDATSQDWVAKMVVTLLLLCLIVAAARILEFLWWKPKRLERILKQQGFKGNPYRLLYGDIRDDVKMLQEARSKPLPLYSHDIVPRIAPILDKILKDYGKTTFTWHGTTPRVIINDPELVREILSSRFDDFGKPKRHKLGRFLLTGLLTSEGEKWVKHRRIINPVFHVEKLKLIIPAFSNCCSIMIQKWENLLPSGGYVELDVWQELQTFTGDVISQTAFGSSYEEEKHIFKLQTEQAEIFIRSMQSIRSLYVPGYRFLPTRDNKRRIEIEKEVQAILRGIIEKRKKTMKAGIKNDDLLGYLMESNLKQMQENGDSEKMGMTIDEVIDECKLFYFAGQETTAVLLTWTMILLGMYPSWQDRAREEILQIFGKNTPNFNDLNHLKIVTMILNEVLRFYSPAPLLVRCANKDIKLREFTLPQGVHVVLPMIFIHRDPKYWGDDAHEFKPERFAEGVSKASKNRMAFFPFSGGPRVCIGQGFAMLEAKLALSMILQHFSFELSPSYIHAPVSIITIQPQHGAPIMLRKL